MANPIDLIITKQALEVVDSAIAKVNLLDKTMQEATQHFIDNSKKMASATPSGVNGSAENNAAVTAQLKAQSDTIAKLSKELENLNNKLIKLNEAKATNKKLTVEETVANQALRKSAVEEAKANSELIGSYEKLNIKHQQAVRNAQNLGATYGSTSKQFLDASKTANVLDEELKTLDSTLGKNQRNVGNYKSGYNALGNSINQLTREAPAFANSLNTGFMAISNNIPALTDAIKGIREENTRLRADGQPTVSVFRQLAASIISWQTAISLGVTLLTVYGGAIVGAITGSKKRKEALEKEKKAIEEKTQAEQDARDAIASNQATEVSRSQVLFETAKNLTLSYTQRIKAVNELKERYPDYLGHLTNEEILAGKTAKAEEELNAALINRGKALAAQKFLQTNLEKQLSLEIEIDKLAQKELKYNTEASKNGSKIIVYTDAQKQIQQQKADIERKANSENLFALRTRLSGLKNEQSAFLDIYNANAKYLDIVKETNKEKDKGKDTTPKVQQLESSLKSVGTIIAQINTEIDRLTVDKIVSDKSALPAINFQLEQLVKLKKQLMGALPTAPGTILNPITPEALANVKEMSDAMKSYLKSFVTEFASNTGFTNFLSSLDPENPDSLYNKIKEGNAFSKENWKATTVDIMESAQEMYNFLNQNSQANFDAEKSRLQSQYDVSLKYAGDSKEAQAKLANDLEAQKKDIANREARAKQKQAIFNIALDTAQAIIGLWANPGFPAAIPLAIAVGALGAVQIGMVASQEVPQYWMGGTHDGGLMMVNDGAGINYQETIVTPDGKIMKPTGRNVIMDAPAGTEIYTHDMWQNMLFDMLQGKGISMSANNQYSGITKADMYDVLMDTLGSQPQYVSNFDADGATDYIIKGGNKTIINRNRGNGRGVRV